MRRRFAIITEIIAPYRIPVFNALAKQGDVDLHVIFLSETDPSLRQWEIYNQEIQFSYEVLPAWRARICNYNVLMNRGLARALDHFDPEVLVCGGYSYLASWQALAWAKLRHVPIALWVESTQHDRRRALPPVEMAKRFFMRSCDAFLVPGSASKQYLVDLGAAPDQIVLAPNAVDVRLFSAGANHARENDAAIRSKWQLPRRFFVFAGRLIEYKGIFDLLDAYAQLPAELRREIGLVYVGDGKSRSELLRRAATVSPGAVRVAGFRQRDELPNFYGLAEALVLPSHNDAWGLVVNEAMACRLPVIASDVTGCVGDLVHNGENGFVVSAHDVDGLAEAMKRVAVDRQCAIAMGRRSLELIANYTPEKCAAGFSSLRFDNISGAATWKLIA
jgi:glycosyltransferase involved in cell wall biosynthesis